MKSFLTVVTTAALFLAPAATGRSASLAADVSTEVTPDGACGTSAGSSNATFDSNNHRMVVTAGGRMIAVYDPHGDGGVDLAWKDPGAAWKEKSIFEGGLDEVSNDRPASIALDGTGRAWVVWSGYSERFGPVKMRRLTNLDAAGGPAMGGVTTVQSGGPDPADPDNTAKYRGGAAVDIAFHGGRGHIVWLQRTDGGYSLAADSFTDLDNPTPPLLGRTILDESSSKQITATLVPTPAGMRAVARTDDLRLFRYETTSGWTGGSATTDAPAEARPSAVAFGSDVLAAFQSSSSPGAVKVARFSNTGSSVDTSLSTGGGYAEPAIAAGAGKAWVVMVGASGDLVVARTFNGSSWGPDATLMTAAAGEGVFTWPNTLREVGGALRFLVGQRCAERPRTSRSAVWSFEQNVSAAPLNTTITDGPEGRINDDTPTFGFSARSGADFECRIDGDDFARCSSPYTVEALGDGPHTFYVQALDGIDVEDNPAERTFIVDTVAPETRIINHPRLRTKIRRAEFSFRADQRSNFTCNLDGAGFKPCSLPGVFRSTKVYRGLETGRHRFKVRAIDRAGNVDPTPAVWRWRVARR
ncbi:MAG: hypothetical protein ACRDJ2_01370 [Actinomycetota bacterium]